jgi:hypothetical protein
LTDDDAGAADFQWPDEGAGMVVKDTAMDDGWLCLSLSLFA